jgi:hypothetical protein
MKFSKYRRLKPVLQQVGKILLGRITYTVARFAKVSAKLKRKHIKFILVSYRFILEAVKNIKNKHISENCFCLQCVYTKICKWKNF